MKEENITVDSVIAQVVDSCKSSGKICTISDSNSLKIVRCPALARSTVIKSF